MKRRKWLVMLIPVLLISFGFALLHWMKPEYAYMPSKNKIMNPSAINALKVKGVHYYDRWGKTLKQNDLQKATVDEKDNSANSGTVLVNQELMKLGREMLYKETFGNEVFMTDILGIVDGPLTIGNIAKAIVRLKGKGTTNLRVELAQDITIGDRIYRKGEKIDTGIDVPKGAYAPLGMPVKYADGRMKVGITCMACHATVDSKSKRVIEGAPNNDLNVGLLMALATNSAAYFTHTDVENVKRYINEVKRSVPTSIGSSDQLPDPAALEKAVDATLANWPKGNFDSTIDMKSNPAQIPDSFTKGGHPYGWSGFAMAGPFNGLAAFSNNVHSQNSDSLSQSEASRALFNLDKEVYLGILLQNAANPKYRYDTKSGVKPSVFFSKVDPTPGVPGVNEVIKPPSFPKLTLMAPDGLFISSPGYKAGEQVYAMAAYQNAILPPAENRKSNSSVIAAGEAVFKKAQCISCHAGEAYTNHRILSVPEIGTEPSRAQALKKTRRLFGDATFYPPDTPVPLPTDAEAIVIPDEHLDPSQIQLGYAWGDSPGGYKVKGLIGLKWTAPYLHDGGVAVGRDLSQLGIAGTVLKGVIPDPENSLRALVDRELRRKVIEANRSSEQLKKMHVSGIGHEFYVDQFTGFTKQQQDALIRYLQSLTVTINEKSHAK
jgi:hypothetical protein